MENAFLTWARSYVDHIDQRLPWLETRRITMGEMRDGVRIDTTQEMIDELYRQRDELSALIATHEARGT